MKVWVVEVSVGFESYDLVGVFSTEEKAIEAMNTFPSYCELRLYDREIDKMFY